MKNILKTSLILGVVATLAIVVPKVTEGAVVITEYVRDLVGENMNIASEPKEAMGKTGYAPEYGATVMVDKLTKPGSVNMCETQFRFKGLLSSKYTTKGYVIHNYRTNGYVSTDTYGAANGYPEYGTYSVWITNNPTYVKSTEKSTNFQNFSTTHIYGITRSIKG